MGFSNGKYNINDSPAANSEGKKKKKGFSGSKFWVWILVFFFLKNFIFLF